MAVSSMNTENDVTTERRQGGLILLVLVPREIDIDGHSGQERQFTLAESVVYFARDRRQHLSA
jgi:hypothetical protein